MFSGNPRAKAIATAPAPIPLVPTQWGSALPSTTPQPNRQVERPRANPATRWVASANGWIMSYTNTARVAVIPGSAWVKTCASAQPEPAMNATITIQAV